MFDSTTIHAGDINHSVSFNSVAGTLVKSSPESKFLRFHMNSPMAESVFHTNTPYKSKNSNYPYKQKQIIVLQVMLCGGDQFMVEYLDKDSND